MGKGSTRRPEAKPGAFAEGWERTFGEPNVWDVLREYTGSIEAPRDWASAKNRYLYGKPDTDKE